MHHRVLVARMRNQRRIAYSSSRAGNLPSLRDFESLSFLLPLLHLENSIMSTVENKSWIFNEVPTGFPVVGQTTIVKSTQIDLDAIPVHGGLLTKTLALSLDPYMRGRMRAPERKSYSPYVLTKQAEEVRLTQCAWWTVLSTSASLSGRWVYREFCAPSFPNSPSALSSTDSTLSSRTTSSPLTTYVSSVSLESIPTDSLCSQIIPTGLRIVKNDEGLPWTNWVGAAGMPGLTAYWSYANIGKPKKGETIFGEINSTSR